jgi:hypothetical protein
MGNASLHGQGASSTRVGDERPPQWRCGCRHLAGIESRRPSCLHCRWARGCRWCPHLLRRRRLMSAPNPLLGHHGLLESGATAAGTRIFGAGSTYWTRPRRCILACIGSHLMLRRCASSGSPKREKRGALFREKPDPQLCRHHCSCHRSLTAKQRRARTRHPARKIREPSPGIPP